METDSTLNKKRPRWSFPVFSSPAPFCDLRRDNFVVQLLSDQGLEDAEMVHVDANGHWRAASKPAESDSSAAVSVKESISVISSNNPITAAVLPLRNGASTTSACRPVTSMEPNVSHFNDCVFLLDDDDDDQEGSSTLSEQPYGAHPTSSNDWRGPPLYTAVIDEQSGELNSATLGSAQKNFRVSIDMDFLVYKAKGFVDKHPFIAGYTSRTCAIATFFRHNRELQSPGGDPALPPRAPPLERHLVQTRCIVPLEPYRKGYATSSPSFRCCCCCQHLRDILCHTGIRKSVHAEEGY
ncbi:unnamed protein product [Schistocephalus solidus]|uniref:Uncharacterized protein n=1 Tax=Schistocephalus solidus TaxID=70667 RepID=A0A183SAJ6_SCHSO|nr:unnamed protein product [Schistocephalus solidus]